MGGGHALEGWGEELVGMRVSGVIEGVDDEGLIEAYDGERETFSVNFKHRGIHFVHSHQVERLLCGGQSRYAGMHRYGRVTCLTDLHGHCPCQPSAAALSGVIEGPFPLKVGDVTDASGLECQWMISAQHVNASLQLTLLDMEAYYQYLSIIECNSPQCDVRHELAQFTGSGEVGGVLTSRTGHMLVHFVSYGILNRGHFSAVWKTGVCQRVPESSDGSGQRLVNNTSNTFLRSLERGERARGAAGTRVGGGSSSGSSGGGGGGGGGGERRRDDGAAAGGEDATARQQQLQQLQQRQQQEAAEGGALDELLATRPLISVVIPSFERYDYLVNAIHSVRRQEYKNLEIIVVDDGSSDVRYRLLSQIQYTRTSREGVTQRVNVTVLHMQRNSRSAFGFSNINRIRNVGINASSGEYIALLDDDDLWLPNKLLLQLQHMARYRLHMSATDGFVGAGSHAAVESLLSKTETETETEDDRRGLDISELGFAQKLHEDYGEIKSIYRQKGAFEKYFVDNDFPEIWTYAFISIHNSITTSSVLFKRALVDAVGLMPEVPAPAEDWKMWLKLLTVTDCVLVKEPCFYYDASHARGKLYT